MPSVCRPFARFCALLPFLATPLPAQALETVDLVGGFQLDPVQVGYQATGHDPAAARVRGCPGYGDSAPALVTTLSEANARLHLFLVGDGAAGFLVTGPDGIDRCEVPDQYGITHTRFERIMSGEYLVWPLAAEPGATVSGALLFSEIDLAPRDVANITGLEIDPALLPPAVAVDLSAEPAFGRVVMPDSGVIGLAVFPEGEIPAEEVAAGCAGAITPSRPDITLSLPAPEPVLAIGANSSTDTTLMVVSPGGDAYCNDDMGGFDPAVVIENAVPGDYAIWVGIYSGAGSEHAAVTIGRTPPMAPDSTGPAYGAVELGLAAEPAFGSHELPADGPLEVSVVLAGGIHAGDAAPGCFGEIDATRPDAVVALAAPEPELWFRVGPESSDTTLVVVGPDGEPACNDDHEGVSSAVGFHGAAPGTYAVWIGGYGGSTGTEATLVVGRTAPDGGVAGGPEENPFIGQQIDSATAALALLTDALGVSGALAYERLEETGPEGLILHGVALQDPAGEAEPMRIGRVRVSELDFAGLSSYGAPERFALVLEDVAYDSVAAGARSNDVPLPVLADAPPLSMSFSLLPPGGDATRRELRFGLSLDGHVGVALAAQTLWQEGMAALGPAAAFMTEGDTFEMELHDMGFLGAVLREVAAEDGDDVDVLVTEILDGLSGMLGQMPPGSPRARLYEAVSAKLTDLDRAGVLRIRLAAAEPRNIEVIADALMADTLDESQLRLEVSYQPDP